MFLITTNLILELKEFIKMSKAIISGCCDGAFIVTLIVATLIAFIKLKSYIHSF